ncbi:MAG: hypothetical protein ACE14L_15445 [Terriglobales bacterium]
MQNIIPANATIEDLEKKAAECERRAKEEKEPVATQLKEEAELCRAWVARLRTGLWTS